jgi:hypothetical protein
LFDFGFEMLTRNRLHHETKLLCLFARHRIAGHRQAFCPLWSDVVEPHVVRQRAEIARRREAEGRIVRSDDHVTQERDIRAAGQTKAVCLADARFMHVEKRHSITLCALELPCVVVDAAAAAIPVGVVLDTRHRYVAIAAMQIVTGRKRAAGAFDDDAMDVAVVVGFPQCFVQLDHHLHRDRIELFRPVQRKAHAAVVFFVHDALEIAHVTPPATI